MQAQRAGMRTDDPHLLLLRVPDILVISNFHQAAAAADLAFFVQIKKRGGLVPALVGASCRECMRLNGA